MELKTDSGPVRGSKRSRYMAWLTGRLETNAWTGAATLRAAFALAEKDVQSARTLAECRTIGRVQGWAYDAGYAARAAQE